MSAELIKELRKMTGAGLLDCKKALEASNSDLEAAKDWIRAKGLATSSKIASRTAAEGAAAIKIVDNKAIIVEVNSETDFVAKGEQFQDIVNTILDIGINQSNNLDDLKTAKTSEGKTIEEIIQDNIIAIRENISIRRMEIMEVNNGAIGSYIHNKIANNMGKIAVLVALESDAPVPELQSLAYKIAIHISAAKPLSLTVDDLDPNHIEKEKAIYHEQATSSGKPENVILKMMEGMMKKFYEEVVLLEQYFIGSSTDKQKIIELIEEASKTHGTQIRIAKFIRYEVGEGITQVVKNFADEVSSMTNQ